MIILGVPIRKPSFRELTVSVAIAVALWGLLMTFGSPGQTKMAAGATLAAITFGCVSSACGVNATKGIRHIALNVAGCIVVLAAYLLIVAAFSG